MAVSAFPTRAPLGGAVPSVSPTPPLGGAYADNYRAMDQINRQLAGSIESGYRQVAGDQSRANDALQRGHQELATWLGEQATKYQDAVRSGYAGLGDQLAGMARATGADLGQGYANLASQMRGIGGWGGGELQNLYNRQADIDSRYAGLQRDVLGDIESIGRSARMDIEGRYRQDEARARMDLSRRGLANSTVVDAMTRAARFDRERADIDLADRLAQTRATARSQLGLAGLAYRERAGDLQNNQSRFNQTTAMGALERGEAARLGFGERNAADERGVLERAGMARVGSDERAGLNAVAMQERLGAARLGFGERANQADTGLGLRQLDWMNSIQAPYPDPGLYAQLAALSDQASRNRNAGGGAGGGAGGLTTTRGGPWSPPRLTPMEQYGGAGGGSRDAFGNTLTNTGQFISGGAGSWTAGQLRSAGGLQPGGGLSGSPYAPPPTGFGGGGGSGAYPDQFDGGGGTAGGGLAPGGGISTSPYAPPPGAGFGGGFGSLADPQQYNTPPSGLTPTTGTPYAPAGGGFGGGFGGGPASRFTDAQWLDFIAGD